MQAPSNGFFAGCEQNIGEKCGGVSEKVERGWDKRNRLTPSLYFLVFGFPPSFVPFAQAFGNACVNACYAG